MNQNIRLRLIEWGVSAERTPPERMVRKAMDIEISEEADWDDKRKPSRAEVGQVRKSNERTPALQTCEGGKRVRSGGKPDRVRVNAMTPRPHAEQSQPRGQGRRRHGRKLGRASESSFEPPGSASSARRKGMISGIAKSCIR